MATGATGGRRDTSPPGGIRDKLKLRKVICGSEIRSEKMRLAIESKLGLESSYDIAGMTEMYGPGTAIDCDEHNGLHYWADMFIIEILDPETLQPVPEGEVGEMVVTSLRKEAVPLLRYRTHDLSRLLPGDCPCGLSMPRHDRILGRSDDMIIYRGVNIYPGQIMDAMIVANRHGHIACTQGGECLAGLVNARALGLVGDDEHAVLDATAHALKFSGFQDMYFNDSFPEAYGVKPQAELSNKPELLLPESAREGKDVATFARMGADAVVARLGLSRK